MDDVWVAGKSNNGHCPLGQDGLRTMLLPTTRKAKEGRAKHEEGATVGS